MRVERVDRRGDRQKWNEATRQVTEQRRRVLLEGPWHQHRRRENRRDQVEGNQLSGEPKALLVRKIRGRSPVDNFAGARAHGGLSRPRKGSRQRASPRFARDERRLQADDRRGLCFARAAVYAMPMRSLWRWSPMLLVLSGATVLGACRRGPAPRITLQDVERCERGIDLAASQATLQEVMSSFYRECSDTCAEPACRQGFLRSGGRASRSPGADRARALLQGRTVRCLRSESWRPAIPLSS